MSSPAVSAFNSDDGAGPVSSTEQPIGRVMSLGEKPVRTMINVVMKNGRSLKEGSLILTNKRLAFVTGKVNLADKDISSTLQGGNVSEIPLDNVAAVTGNRGILRPSLIVLWHNQPGDQNTTRTEFIQNYKPKNLEEVRNGINEWAPLIEENAIPNEEGSNLESESKVSEKELRGRVLDELGDMQWKGFFQISKELREKYDISVDPDSLENVCHELAKEKLIEEDKYGAFFRKIQTTK